MITIYPWRFIMSNLNIKTAIIGDQRYAILAIQRRVVIESWRLRRTIRIKIELVQHIKQHCLDYLKKIYPKMKRMGYSNMNEFIGHHPGYIVSCMKSWKKNKPNQKWKHYFEKDELYLLIRSYIGIDPNSSIWEVKQFGDYTTTINDCDNAKPNEIKRIDQDKIVYSTGEYVSFRTRGSVVYPEYIKEVKLTRINKHYVAKLIYHIPIDRVVVDMTQRKYIQYNGSALIPIVTDTINDKENFSYLVVGEELAEYFKKLTEKIRSNFVDFDQYKKIQYLPSTNIDSIRVLFENEENITKEILDSYCRLLNGLVEVQIKYALLRTRILECFGVKLIPHNKPGKSTDRKTQIGIYRQFTT